MCCFCNRALEDERSTAVGYGPICAGHFGLAWGNRPAEFAATPVARPARQAVATIDADELATGLKKKGRGR